MNLNLVYGLILEVMLPMAFLVGAGGAWQWRGEKSAINSLRRGLNHIVLYIFSPALMFAIAASTPISPELLSVPLLVGLGLLISGAILYLLLFKLTLFHGLSPATRAVLMLSGMFGNVLFVGIPVLTYLFGESAQRYPAYVDMVVSIPLVWSVGVWICVRLGASPGAEDISVWRTMVRQPPLWGFVAGLGLQYSELLLMPLINATRLIGSATVPTMLFVIGLSIPWRRLRPSGAVLTVIAIKLLLFPLIVWALAKFLFSPLTEPHYAAIIEAAMPTMTLAVLFADRFNLDVDTAGLMIAWSLALFLISLPLWLWLTL